MSNINNFEDLSRNEVKELLKKWRENNERRGEDVLDLWEIISENDFHKMGAEKHVILEQVTFAALDCHYYGIAKSCIDLLEADFPNSLRVEKLKAALFEAAEKYAGALEILDSIIEMDVTNAPARKRRVAILKAQGQIPEAIKELVDYLKKFMSDVEGWQELCELYQQVGEYARAAFCAEELILHQPHNHLIHQRLADIRYTMGGVENMEIAKTYYCHALKLNPDNMRALLGLFLACNNLALHYKAAGGGKRKEAWRLARWAQTRVAARTKAASVAPSPSPSPSPARKAAAGVAQPDLAEMMLSLVLAD